MRRLILLLTTVAIGSLLVYRRRTIDRWERQLGIRSRPAGGAPGR